jgi:hypothetical protein
MDATLEKGETGMFHTARNTELTLVNKIEQSRDLITSNEEKPYQMSQRNEIKFEESNFDTNRNSGRSPLYVARVAPSFGVSYPLNAISMDNRPKSQARPSRAP